MGLLWDRNVAVVFGPKEVFGPGIAGQSGASFNRLRVENLRISFTIEKQSEINQNTAKIQIYNLSKSSLAFLDVDNPIILLEVGYGSVMSNGGSRKRNYDGIIFYGDITDNKFLHQGADTITSIEAGDGLQSLLKARIDKSFAGIDLNKAGSKGTNLKVVMEELLTTFKTVGGIVKEKALKYIKSDAIPDKYAENGLCLSGMVKDILDDLLKSFGLEWSIQDNEVQIIPEGGNTNEEAIVLTPQTGLIGSPVKKIVEMQTSDKIDGIEFTALIQPGLNPGRLVEIKSRDTNGIFRIRKSNFIGDTHDIPFYVTATASVREEAIV